MVQAKALYNAGCVLNHFWNSTMMDMGAGLVCGGDALNLLRKYHPVLEGRSAVIRVNASYAKDNNAMYWQGRWVKTGFLVGSYVFP